MRNKLLLNDSTRRKQSIYAFSFFVALFVMAASTFAQVIPDKVRTIPTTDDDPTTQFLIVTHATDSNFQHRLFHEKGQFLDDANPVEFLQAGDFVEYQIISPTGGNFTAILQLATKTNPGEVNVSVYKTESEEWSETGSTNNAYTGNWTNWKEQIYPFYVEAGVYYTLRISWHHGVNFNGLRVEELNGSPDASLSDLKIDGATIEGFDPEIFEYSIALPPYVWINSLEATTTDPNASVDVPTDLAPGEGVNTATFTIPVTSEGGIVKDYTIKVVSPILIDDGVSLKMADDVFYSNGVNASNTKVNNINNNDYIDYYIYSEYDDNYIVTLNIANGYDPSDSYLNVSTLTLGDTTWMLNNLYTKSIPTTRNASGGGSWSTDDAVNHDFIISAKAGVPSLFRIYGITDKGNAADIFSMTFKLLDASVGIDATLSDLKVDGVTIEGFAPDITSYDVPLPVGAASASVEATATDGDAQVTGVGAFTMDGIKSIDTISVTSESGFAIDYKVNFYSPMEINFALMDTLPVYMASSMFYNSGIRATDSKLNYFYDSLYVEYYVYSATDKDVHLIANMSNGNPDTITCKLNVSTYTYGTEWVLDDAYTQDVPSAGEGMWSIENATELDYNISLKAGEPVIVRLFSITDGWLGAGDVLSLRVVEGKSGSTAVHTVEKGNVRVWGASGALNVLCDDSYVGGSVQVYDISGRLMLNETMTSTRTAYELERSGLYIVKVVGANNEITTLKCLLK